MLSTGADSDFATSLDMVCIYVCVLSNAPTHETRHTVGIETIFNISHPIPQSLPYNLYSAMKLCIEVQRKKGISNTTRDPVLSPVHARKSMILDYVHLNFIYCGGLI